MDKNQKLTSTPLLLTFKEKEPPRFVEIPVEQAKIKVYEYYEKPMSCKTCLGYGHTVKIFHGTIATCAKGSCKAHNRDKCTSTEVRCCHSGDDHQALSTNYPLFKRETEIVQIQTKECITRLQAILKLHRLNLNPEFIFSNTVKNSSNRATTNSPTRTDQESQFTACTVLRPRIPYSGKR